MPFKRPNTMPILQQVRDSFGSWIDALIVEEEDGLTNFFTGRSHSLFTASVRTVAFSSDGKVIVSGSFDETIRLWEEQSGTCLKVLRSDRPYERMNITGVSGLTEAQKVTLKVLGAIEDI